MLGYLSPEGKFYKCEHYGHLNLASNICKDIYGETDLRSEEDYLAKKGWMIFTREYAGINYFNLSPQSRLLFTDEQLEWIGQHLNELYSEQKMYLSCQLEREQKNRRHDCDAGSSWAELNLKLNDFVLQYEW